ncbi:hypothetical protein RRF57_000501 [Xylaria bambusicola]|uniref:Uncharacterized protein n=1 Tax=Xylaria bambusicola TaxID=326684 RepID=A0AAN7YU81_9PEZI
MAPKACNKITLQYDTERSLITYPLPDSSLSRFAPLLKDPGYDAEEAYHIARCCWQSHGQSCGFLHDDHFTNEGLSARFQEEFDGLTGFDSTKSTHIDRR